MRLINELYPYEKGTKKRSYQERSWAAGVGVERVAKSHTVPVYHSTPAETDQDIRWVQIDLGQSRTIDCIKLLPHPYHPSIGLASRGFPVRFKIEVCNEESFQKPLLVYDRTQSDYPFPKDNICTFPGRGKQGRFIRLTATRLNQRLLELVKFEVYSKGVDIAEDRPVSDSHGGIHHEALTCPPRPQGERVVTDNPGNIIPHARWKPVQYKAVAPKKGVALGKGLFKTTMDNNHSKILDRACCYEKFFLHLRPNSRPA